MKKAALTSLTVLLIIALFFASGCGDFPGTGSSDTRTAVLGANEGLDISFLPNSPPAELFPNNPFEIVVQVENKGQYDIPSNNIIVYLAGLNPNLFNVDSGTKTVDTQLDGVKSYGTSVVPGMTDRAEFISDSGYTGPLGGDSPFTAIAKVCYEYKTFASAQVCVKSLSSQQSICNITSPKTVTSSGAPIKISKIEELPMGQPSPDKVTLGFNIHISNVANGHPFRGDLTSCSSIPYVDLDYVSVESVLLDNTNFDIQKCAEGSNQDSCCWFNRESNDVQLVNGEGKVLCQITTDSSVAYTGVLQANITYNYADQVSKQFTVRKIGV